jgi:hypothetical protein
VDLAADHSRTGRKGMALDMTRGLGNAREEMGEGVQRRSVGLISLPWGLWSVARIPLVSFFRPPCDSPKGNALCKTRDNPTTIQHLWAAPEVPARTWPV